MDIREWMDDARKGGSQFADWRDNGKIVFFLHPRTQFKKRTQIRVPVIREDNKGEEQIWTIPRHYLGDEDIVAKFITWLRAAEHITMPTVVLELTVGDKTEQWRKGDLLRVRGYDWRKNILFPRKEYLFTIIQVKNPKEPEILQVPVTVGKKITKLIDDEIEELGEDEGNPMVTPWAIQLKYDEKARGMDMYSVRRSNLPVSDAVRTIMEEHDAIDLDQYCVPQADEEQDGSTFELLQKACVVHCDLLETDIVTEPPASPPPPPMSRPSPATAPRQATQRPAAPPTATANVPSAARPRPTSPRPVTVRPATVQPATAPATAPRQATQRPAAPPTTVASPPKPPSRPQRPGTATGGVTVGKCKVGSSYVHNGEQLVFGGLAGGIGFFYDEDNCKVNILSDVIVQPTSNVASTPQVADDQDDQGDSLNALTVRDLGPDYRDQMFYDSNGARLKFVRYNDSREKGVFQDENGERVFLDGGELVSLDSSDQTDVELQPMEEAVKEPPVSPASPSQDAPSFICPNCQGVVSETDAECPHCQIKFVIDDADATPFDEG